MITDRTEADVLLENEKGTYGFTDLNRVEREVDRLRGFFPRLGIRDDLTVKTDWAVPGDFSVEHWPTEAQMKRYLANVERMRREFRISLRLPDTMNGLTYEGANRIEQVLVTAGERIGAILASFRYSGEIFSGEDFL